MNPPNGLTVRGFVATGAGASDAHEIPGQHEVVGQVKGLVPEGATVRAVLQTLRDGVLSEHVVAEGVVNSTGWYRVAYARQERSTGSSDTSLSVRLYAPGGELIAESMPVLVPTRRTRVDLRPRRASGGPSEYLLLERRIVEELQTGLAGLDSVEESAAIEEVSDWLDVDAERLMMFQRARALQSETGLPGSVFYALGRSGMGLAVEDLLDVPIYELRTTIEEAAANGIVDSDLIGNLDSLVEQLAHHVVEHAIRTDRQPASPGLNEVLAAADLPAGTIAHVPRSYQARESGAAEFWESLTEAGELTEALGDETAREVETAVRLGAVLGPEPALLRRMHQLRREGRWQVPEDLSRFTFDEWCELLEELKSSQEEEVLPDDHEAEDAQAEEESQGRIEAHAEAILDTLEEVFPRQCIHHRLVESEELSADARGLLARARRAATGPRARRTRSLEHPSPRGGGSR
jgi:hypothetical protein